MNESASETSEDETEDEEEEIEEDVRAPTPVPTMGRGTPRPSLSSSRPASPTNSVSEESINWTFPHLPWEPKVTISEMNDYISTARLKFLDYSLSYGKRYVFRSFL